MWLVVVFKISNPDVDKHEEQEEGLSEIFRTDFTGIGRRFL
jgi:hypothetical protein